MTTIANLPTAVATQISFVGKSLCTSVTPSRVIQTRQGLIHAYKMWEKMTPAQLEKEFLATSMLKKLSAIKGRTIQSKILNLQVMNVSRSLLAGLYTAKGGVA